MKPQFFFWLAGSMAAFLSAATASRAYVSGNNVSLLILFAKRDQLNSKFITVPLDLRSPSWLAVLSCIINSKPGTVWVYISPESQALALHVFDLHVAYWWIGRITTR